MAIDIVANRSDSICLSEFEELFHEASIPPQDPGALASLAPLLKRLHNNRTFLGELIIEDMIQQAESQVNSAYSAQVMILSKMSKNFFLRGAFWPAATDELNRKTGTDLFAYDQPHDHNFNFLTVGYFGPGYYSEYYEYEYDSLVGYPGEPVELIPSKARWLAEGDILLYRAHRDVHTQHPPRELSITLNILDCSPTLRNQYLFSNDRTQVEKISGTGSAWPFLDAAASLCGNNSMAPFLYIADHHIDPNTRYHALKAAASVAGGESEVESVMRIGLRNTSESVRGWSKRYLEWITGDTAIAVDWES